MTPEEVKELQVVLLIDMLDQLGRRVPIPTVRFAIEFIQNFAAERGLNLNQGE